jgi:hypothetical protein
VNTPDPPDIPSVIEQLDSAVEHVPDWLWQGVASNLISEGLIATPFLVWLAWKHRKEIATKLLRSNPQPFAASGGGSVSRFRYSGSTATVREHDVIRPAFGNTTSRSFPPTLIAQPSLAEQIADEGLELLYWYLRQA